MNIATQEKEEAQARSSSMMASSSLLSMFVLNEYRRILVQNKQQTNNKQTTLRYHKIFVALTTVLAKKCSIHDKEPVPQSTVLINLMFTSR